ncbi:MAG: hypothetical protein ACK5KO_03545 [Arachnia sp.]
MNSPGIGQYDGVPAEPLRFEASHRKVVRSAKVAVWVGWCGAVVLLLVVAVAAVTRRYQSWMLWQIMSMTFLIVAMVLLRWETKPLQRVRVAVGSQLMQVWSGKYEWTVPMAAVRGVELHDSGAGCAPQPFVTVAVDASAMTDEMRQWARRIRSSGQDPRPANWLEIPMDPIHGPQLAEALRRRISPAAGR